MKVPPGFLALLDRFLEEENRRSQARVEVVIRTDRNLKDGYYLDLVAELERPQRRQWISKKYDGVKEKTG
jgi:hypothetical protein